MTARPRVATVWLGGCSGCHMSLLDMDERLLELAQAMDLVYSPFVDAKEFPDGVDITLVEGAVANEEHLQQIELVRARSRIVVAFGDCAAMGNVTALRNPLGSETSVIARAYIELTAVNPGAPALPGIVPALLPRVHAIGDVVDVDVFLPGCPPSADLIHYVLSELVAGRRPGPELRGRLRFG